MFNILHCGKLDIDQLFRDVGMWYVIVFASTTSLLKNCCYDPIFYPQKNMKPLVFSSYFAKLLIFIIYETIFKMTKVFQINFVNKIFQIQNNLYTWQVWSSADDFGWPVSKLMSKVIFYLSWIDDQDSFNI